MSMWHELDMEQLARESYVSPAFHTKKEIEELVVLIRLELYNNSQPCGRKIIQKRLDEMLVIPLPSLSTIGSVLQKRGLTYKRTGHFV